MVRKLVTLAIAGALVAPAIARAQPGDCADPCGIEVVGFEYVAPVNAIASGTTVRWTTLTETHPTANETSPESACFSVDVGDGVPVEPVRFDVTGGGVEATTLPGTAEETTAPCQNVVPLADGVWALPFQCLLHTFMRGALIVHD